MKNSVFFFGGLLFLTACSGVLYNPLDAKPSYIEILNFNYSKIGQCLDKNLIDLNYTVDSLQHKIKSIDNTKEKTYYINESSSAPLASYKNWSIVIKNLNDKNNKSEIQIRSLKKGIGIEPIAPVNLIKRYIKGCKIELSTAKR